MASNLDTGGSNVRRQALSVILIGCVLIGAYVTFVAVSESFFQAGRYEQQGQLDGADILDVEEIPIAFPNFSLPDNFMDMDWLMEMLGGAALLSGLFGGFGNMDQLQTVVFRVYREGSTSIDNDDLWRLTAYDEYRGDAWARSDEDQIPLGTTIDDGSISFDDKIDSNYTIRFPYGAAPSTTIALPTAFPYPYIKDGSMDAPNLVGTPSLLKDSMNGSSVQLIFNTSASGNFSYTFFKEFEPDPSSWASVDPDYAPQSIKDTYLQIPGSSATDFDANLVEYRLANLNFDTHYLILDSYIYGNYSNPTTYEIVDLIRNYLNDNFEVDMDFPLERPSTGEDIVDWFLGSGTGLPMDFSAAFVILSRAFGVPCRYASGYNSKYSSDVYDPEVGRDGREIKFYNMDAWNEIYFTTSASGEGRFAPMMISSSSSFSLPIAAPGDNTLDIIINGSYSNQEMGYRNDTFQMDFKLTMLDGNPIENQILTVVDETESQTLGTVMTDSNGDASYILNMNNSFTAGGHVISVAHSLFLQNISLMVLIDDVTVELISVNPAVINRTISDATNVIARIYDPVNLNPVQNAQLSPLLISGGTTLFGSVNPDLILVNGIGQINTIVDIDGSVPDGLYDFRVDFNGSFEVANPYDPGNPYQFVIPLLMDASSNNISFEVIFEQGTPIFNLQINSTTQNGTLYADRSSYLNFSATLRYGVSGSSGTISIYDRTYNNFITSFITDSTTGFGNLVYDISNNPNFWPAGPHELFGVWEESSMQNESFYVIINETVEINVAPLNPNSINRTSGLNTAFNINGTLRDSGTGQIIRYGLVEIRLFSGITNMTDSLDSNPLSMNVDDSGTFTTSYGVDDGISLGNYSVYMAFSGIWDLNGTYFFADPTFSTTSTPEDITVDDHTAYVFNLVINNSIFQNDEFYAQRSNDLLFSAYVKQGLNNRNGTIQIYDRTYDNFITTFSTNSVSGSGSLVYNISSDTDIWPAGPHELYGVWVEAGLLENNSFYVIINETVEILFDPLDPNIINRTTGANTIFNVSGDLWDSGIGQLIRYGNLEIRLYQNVTNSTNLLDQNPLSMNVNATGSYNTAFGVDNSIALGNYSVFMTFDGSWTLPGGYSFTDSMFSNTSELKNLTVDDHTFYIFNLVINSTVFQDDEFFSKRSNDLLFSAYVRQGVFNKNGTIQIYDRTYDDNLITSFTTSSATGYMDYIYDISSDVASWPAGPHELYGLWTESGIQNESFYVIINETVDMVISSIIPATINRSGIFDPTFTITGNLWDPIVTQNIRYGDVSLQLFDSVGSNTTSLLDQNSHTFNSGATGAFSLTFGVDDLTPAGNYNLRMDFNGSWSLPGGFSTLYSSLSSSSLLKLLTIKDPDDINIEFWINGTETLLNYDSSSPPEFQRDQWVNLTVRLTISGIPLSGGNIYFHDVKRGNIVIYSAVTNINGNVSRLFQLNNSFTAGLIRISAEYDRITPSDQFYNYTQIFLNDSMTIVITSDPTDEYERLTDTVTITGYVNDTGSGTAVTGARVKLVVWDSSRIDVTAELSSLTSDLIYSSGSTGIFSFSFSFGGSHQGYYNISIEFYGEFRDFSAICPGTNNSAVLDVNSSEYVATVFADKNDYALEFWIDGIPTRTLYDSLNPPQLFSVNDIVNLTVRLRRDFQYLSNQTINFYDKNNRLLNRSNTDVNGYCTVYLSLNSSYSAGLIGIEAKYLTLSSKFTQILLDGTMTLSDLTITPGMQVESDNHTVTVTGWVSNGGIPSPIEGAKVWLYINDSLGVNKTGDLSEPTSTYTDAFGNFSFSFVFGGTFQGVYSISVLFNGELDYTIGPCRAHNTTASFADNSSAFQIEVYENMTYYELEFWIDGVKTRPNYDNSNPPLIFSHNDIVNFTVRLRNDFKYLKNETVMIYIYNDTKFLYLNFDSTDVNGYASIYLTLNDSYTFGLNLIKVNNTYAQNYTQIILDNQGLISLNNPGNEKIRIVDEVYITGMFIDDISKKSIINAQIWLFVNFSDGTNKTGDLGIVFNTYTASDGSFSFIFTFDLTFQGEYNISVLFVGEQIDTFSACTAYIEESNLAVNSSAFQVSVFASIVLDLDNITVTPFSITNWTIFENVVVSGVLRYDNGSEIIFASIPVVLNVTFEYEGQLAATNSYNDTADYTLGTPDFYTSTKLLWSETDSIYIEMGDLDLYFIKGFDRQLVWGG